MPADWSILPETCGNNISSGQLCYMQSFPFAASCSLPFWQDMSCKLPFCNRERALALVLKRLPVWSGPLPPPRIPCDRLRLCRLCTLVHENVCPYIFAMPGQHASLTQTSSKAECADLAQAWCTRSTAFWRAGTLNFCFTRGLLPCVGNSPHQRGRCLGAH